MQAAVYDEFAQKLTARIESMKVLAGSVPLWVVSCVQVGHGLEDGVVQGPLINAAGLSKVCALTVAAVTELVDRSRHMWQTQCRKAL